MQKQKTSIDIVNEILELCILAYPVSAFIISLYKQYMQRGSLSKKQLQGLHSKAAQINDIPPGKLATLEALVKKMPTRYKSDLPVINAIVEKDETTGLLIDNILAKYPHHKRVLFFKAKYDTQEPLSATEVVELNKFVTFFKNRE